MTISFAAMVEGKGSNLDKAKHAELIHSPELACPAAEKK